MKTKLNFAMLCLFAVAAALPACGGDDDSSTTADDDGAATGDDDAVAVGDDDSTLPADDDITSDDDLAADDDTTGDDTVDDDVADDDTTDDDVTDDDTADDDTADDDTADDDVADDDTADDDVTDDDTADDDTVDDDMVDDDMADDDLTADDDDTAMTYIHINLLKPDGSDGIGQLPIDGASFGYSPSNDRVVSSFAAADFLEDDNRIAGFTLNGDTGETFSLPLTAESVQLPGDANFCVDTDWCQAIQVNPADGSGTIFSPVTGLYADIAPATDAYALTSGNFTGADTTAYSNYISLRTTIDREHGVAYSWGGLGPSIFHKTLFRYDLTAHDVTVVADGLPALAENCLAIDTTGNRVFSFGGMQSEVVDVSDTTGAIYAVDVATGLLSEVGVLPFAARRSMACVHDPSRNVMYLFGGYIPPEDTDECKADPAIPECNGMIYQDRYQYFTDLWSLNLADMSWTKLIESNPQGNIESFGGGSEGTLYRGDPNGPNFSYNGGYLLYDGDNDRLFLGGPISQLGNEFFLVNLR